MDVKAKKFIKILLSFTLRLLSGWIFTNVNKDQTIERLQMNDMHLRQERLWTQCLLLTVEQDTVFWTKCFEIALTLTMLHSARSAKRVSTLLSNLKTNRWIKVGMHSEHHQIVSINMILYQNKKSGKGTYKHLNIAATTDRKAKVWGYSIELTQTWPCYLNFS